MRPLYALFLVLLIAIPRGGWTQAHSAEIEAVVLHPIVADTFVCAEHALGELDRLGDALGRDCLVIRMDDTAAPGRALPSLFRGDGLANEDWFGWEVPLLAPFDGTVESVEVNPVTNRPGELPQLPSPAGSIRFARDDGLRVVYAHVRKVLVHPGDTVAAGQPVGAIGNNAVSKAPHVHVGAWKGDTPLQVRFDLRALGELRRSQRPAPTEGAGKREPEM